MRLSITTEQEDIFNLEVDSQMELENFKALLEAESSVPPEQQILYHNGHELTDPSQTLQGYGVKEDEMILLRRKPNGVVGGPRGNPNFTTDPRLLELASANPELFRAALNDPARAAAMIQQLEQIRRQHVAMDSDPFNVELQQKIEEEIKQKNIEASLQVAMEHYPESFGRVTRLYINVEVNGRKIVALVDSGAQSTVMSPETAEMCGLSRLIDTRWNGIAKGVGTAKILGRVHGTQIKLQELYLLCTFFIVEGKGSDMLFGLDMLKRFQAVIDLKKDALIINDIAIPFLSEGELPDDKRRMEVHGGSSEDEIQAEARAAGSVLSIPPAGGASSSTEPSTSLTSVSSPAPVSRPQTSRYSEESIAMLTNLGVSREEAINALDMAGGDAMTAASLLFQG